MIPHAAEQLSPCTTAEPMLQSPETATVEALCHSYWDLPVAQPVKNLPAMQESRLDPWVWKIPWRRKLQPTPVFLPGKFHEQKNLVGHSPWGLRESGTTEQLAYGYMATLLKPTLIQSMLHNKRSHHDEKAMQQN